MSNEPLDTAAMRMRWNDVEYWREMYSHVIFGQAQPDILALANEVDDLRRRVSVPAPTPTVPVEVAETVETSLNRCRDDYEQCAYDYVRNGRKEDAQYKTYIGIIGLIDAALDWLAQAKGATE